MLRIPWCYAVWWVAVLVSGLALGDIKCVPCLGRTPSGTQTQSLVVVTHQNILLFNVGYLWALLHYTYDWSLLVPPATMNKLKQKHFWYQ